MDMLSVRQARTLHKLEARVLHEHNPLILLNRHI
jgi:hypothetical protein